MKQRFDDAEGGMAESRFPRSAWIETIRFGTFFGSNRSRFPRSAWIETACCMKRSRARTGRASLGARGLKYGCRADGGCPRRGGRCRAATAGSGGVWRTCLESCLRRRSHKGTMWKHGLRSMVDGLGFYFFAFSFAAFNNPTNNGCGLIGRDRNSGWNWLPTMYG